MLLCSMYQDELLQILARLVHEFKWTNKVVYTKQKFLVTVKEKLGPHGFMVEVLKDKDIKGFSDKDKAKICKHPSI
ncbi:unnamed protein product [Prunus brigantina]